MSTEYRLRIYNFRSTPVKNIVRVMTLSLAVAGIFATAQTSTKVSNGFAGRVNTVPVPCCPPNDPNACGLK